MMHGFELDIGDEIRDVVCPLCGGSLVWKGGRAWCYEDEYVYPEAYTPLPAFQFSDEEHKWLEDHSLDLED